jgi:hypothetical protein
MKMQNVEWMCMRCPNFGGFRDTEYSLSISHGMFVKPRARQQHLALSPDCAAQHGSQYLEYEIGEPYDFNMGGENATEQSKDEERRQEGDGDGVQTPR